MNPFSEHLETPLRNPNLLFMQMIYLPDYGSCVVHSNVTDAN